MYNMCIYIHIYILNRPKHDIVEVFFPISDQPHYLKSFDSPLSFDHFKTILVQNKCLKFSVQLRFVFSFQICKQDNRHGPTLNDN